MDGKAPYSLHVWSSELCEKNSAQRRLINPLRMALYCRPIRKHQIETAYESSPQINDQRPSFDKIKPDGSKGISIEKTAEEPPASARNQAVRPRGTRRREWGLSITWKIGIG